MENTMKNFYFGTALVFLSFFTLNIQAQTLKSPSLSPHPPALSSNTTKSAKSGVTAPDSNLFTKDEALLALKDLAQQPFSPQSGAERREMMIWIDKSPDININLCGVIAPFVDPSLRKDPLNMILFAQMMFSNAQFQLKNPNVSDEMDKQIAGIDGMLHLYGQVQEKKSNAVNSYAEKLKELKNKNGLKKYVKERCKMDAPATPLNIIS